MHYYLARAWSTIVLPAHKQPNRLNPRKTSALTNGKNHFIGDSSFTPPARTEPPQQHHKCRTRHVTDIILRMKKCIYIHQLRTDYMPLDSITQLSFKDFTIYLRPYHLSMKDKSLGNTYMQSRWMNQREEILPWGLHLRWSEVHAHVTVASTLI